MTERDFVYWLNGFFELSGATYLTDSQVSVIKDHLSLVFNKLTINSPETVEERVELRKLFGKPVPIHEFKLTQITCWGTYAKPRFIKSTTRNS